MVYWYSKGQADYLVGNFHMAFYMDINGYDEVNYDSQDIEGDGESGDPFMAFAIDTETWAYGQGQVEIGLLDSHRIRINSSGVRIWDGDSWEDPLVAGGGDDLGDHTTTQDLIVSSGDKLVFEGLTPSESLEIYDSGLDTANKFINQSVDGSLYIGGYHGVYFRTNDGGAFTVLRLLPSSAYLYVPLTVDGPITVSSSSYDQFQAYRPVSTVNYGAGIQFFLKDSGGVKQQYGVILAAIDVNTADAEYGRVGIHVTVNGSTMQEIARFADAGLTMSRPIAMGSNAITGASNINLTSTSAIQNVFNVGVGGTPREWRIVVDDSPSFYGLYDATHGTYVYQAGGNGGNFDLNRSLELSSGKVITSADEDLTFTFGRMAIGSPTSDIVYLGHRDLLNTTNYALIHTYLGTTHLNASTGQNLRFNINNVNKMSMSATELTSNIPITIGDATAIQGRLNLGTGAGDYAQINIVGGGEIFRFRYEGTSHFKAHLCSFTTNTNDLGSSNTYWRTLFSLNGKFGNNDNYTLIQNVSDVPTINFGGSNQGKITNVADPTNDQDVATKKYVLDNVGITEAQAVQAVEDAGLVLSSTKVIDSADENLTFIFGRNQLGIPFNTAYFGYRGFGASTYAIAQTNTFATYINATTGQVINFAINGVIKMNMSATALTTTVPIAMGTNKITGLGDGVDPQDAMAFGQKYSLEQHDNTYHSTNYHTEADGTGVATVHSDLNSIGSGSIITTAERNALHAKQHAMDDATEHTSSDVAILNSNIVKHGFLKKLDGIGSNYMDGSGSWSVPAGSYGDSEVDARIVVQNTHPSGTIDIAIDALILTHKNISSAHHTIYSLEVHDNDEHDPDYLANLSEDTTPEMMINSTLPTDHTVHGNVLTITNAQAFGKAVYVSANNTVALADKDAVGTMCAIGVSAGTNKVLTQGTIRDDSWTWTFNNVIYVGDDGALTNNISGYGVGDYVQVVGVALNATTVLVKDIFWVKKK